MSSDVLKPVINAIKSRSVEWLESFHEHDNSKIVTPEVLDVLENELHSRIKKDFPPEQKVSHKFVRTHIVATILSEKGVGAFGVTPIYEKKDISEKAIKKYAKKK